MDNRIKKEELELLAGATNSSIEQNTKEDGLTTSSYVQQDYTPVFDINSRIFIQNVMFRSGIEVMWFLVFQELGFEADFEVRTLFLDNKEHTKANQYTPDFLITHNHLKLLSSRDREYFTDAYVEIKDGRAEITQSDILKYDNFLKNCSELKHLILIGRVPNAIQVIYESPAFLVFHNIKDSQRISAGLVELRCIDGIWQFVELENHRMIVDSIHEVIAKSNISLLHYVVTPSDIHDSIEDKLELARACQKAHCLKLNKTGSYDSLEQLRAFGFEGKPGYFEVKPEHAQHKLTNKSDDEIIAQTISTTYSDKAYKVWNFEEHSVDDGMFGTYRETHSMIIAQLKKEMQFLLNIIAMHSENDKETIKRIVKKSPLYQWPYDNLAGWNWDTVQGCFGDSFLDMSIEKAVNHTWRTDNIKEIERKLNK